MSNEPKTERKKKKKSVVEGNGQSAAVAPASTNGSNGHTPSVTPAAIAAPATAPSGRTRAPSAAVIPEFDVFGTQAAATASAEATTANGNNGGDWANFESVHDRSNVKEQWQ